LVLGFYENNSLSSQLRDNVSEAILNNSGRIALRPLLNDSSQGLACYQLSCLQALASQFYDADYIVGGSSQMVPDTADYQLHVWIFDTKATDKPTSERLVWNKADCVGCQNKDGARSDKLAALMTATIEKWLVKDERNRDESRRAVSVNADQRPCWTFTRGLTVGAGAGLTAAGLIAGSSVLALAGPSLELTDQNGDHYRNLDGTVWRPFAAPGFTALGVGLAGMITALAGGHLFGPGPVRDASGRCTAPENRRWTPVRGAAVGVFTGLLAAGLSAALPLSVAHRNITCFTIRNEMQHRSRDLACDWSGNMGVAWGLSGGAVLGLSIALLWPAP